MALDIEPWEPEESVGKIWHALASRLDAPREHAGAEVHLSEISGRLAVLFRGLGGSPAVELKAVATETSGHRLSFLRRLGTPAERAPRASFDGEALRLPGSLAVFPAREANAALYVWLAACAAHAGTVIDVDDPLLADLAAIAAAEAMVAATLADAPGFVSLYNDLKSALLALRPVGHLPAAEAAVEALIRHHLGDPAVSPPDVPLKAPRGYRPFRPVPLWPELRRVGVSESTAVETRATEGPPEEGEGSKSHRARRRKADQAERKDSFILHKFEALLSWAEFMNLNRRVEDDDTDDAKKAADDQDEIGLGPDFQGTGDAPQTASRSGARRCRPRGTLRRDPLSRMGRAHQCLSARACPRADLAISSPAAPRMPSAMIPGPWPASAR